MLKMIWVSIALIFFSSQVQARTPVSPLSEIEKSCKKTYTKNSKEICFCITTNLSAQLSPVQLKALAKAYKNKAARVSLAKNQKNILDKDYEAHTSCQSNASWTFPKEDLGEPDEL